MIRAELSAISPPTVDSTGFQLVQFAQRQLTKTTRFDTNGIATPGFIGLKGLRMINTNKQSDEDKIRPFIKLWTVPEKKGLALKIADPQTAQTSYWDMQTGQFVRVEFDHPENKILYRTMNEYSFMLENGYTGLEQAVVHEDGICSYWNTETNAFLGATFDTGAMNGNNTGNFVNVSEINGWSGDEYQIDHANGMTSFWRHDNHSFLTAHSTQSALCQLGPGYSLPIWA